MQWAYLDVLVHYGTDTDTELPTAEEKFSSNKSYYNQLAYNTYTK